MRIVVISDTHISDRSKGLPAKVIEELKKADMIIHAGDLVDPSVLDKLKSVCPNVKAVWGNMDPYEVRAQLPEKEIFKLDKHKIGVMHGYGPPNKLIDLLYSVFKNEGVSIVIFGHSHFPITERKNGIIFFNPGSLTDKVYAPYNSYGIIEINDKIETRIVKI